MRSNKSNRNSKLRRNNQIRHRSIEPRRWSPWLAKFRGNQSHFRYWSLTMFQNSFRTAKGKLFSAFTLARMSQWLWKFFFLRQGCESSPRFWTDTHAHRQRETIKADCFSSAEIIQSIIRLSTSFDQFLILCRSSFCTDDPDAAPIDGTRGNEEMALLCRKNWFEHEIRSICYRNCLRLVYIYFRLSIK